MLLRQTLRTLAVATLAAALVVGWFQFSPLRAQVVAEPRTPTARAALGEGERRTIDLFETSRRSVVFIATTQRVVDPWTRNPLQVERGTGSGFIWDEFGHVVTNNHVIAGASGAQVRLADGRAYAAELVGTSPDHDLAVLRIRVDDERPAPLPIGTSSDLKVGQDVLAVGNPFGLDWTLTTGIVSALNRELPGEGNGIAIRELIQTDAAINPGNSGGPLLDSAGRLIGVTTAIYSPSGAYAGIGFAVPVDTVNRVVPRLIRSGRYVRPTLGVRVDAQVNRVLAEQLGTEGVFVLAIEPGSPAARAGLKAAQVERDGVVIGDVLLSIGDRPLKQVEDLFDALDRSAAGREVEVTVLRGRERIVVPVRLAEER